MPFERMTAFLAKDGRSVWPGKLFDPYLVQKFYTDGQTGMMINEDDYSDISDAQVFVASSDYENLLRSYEALLELARRGNAV